MHAATSGRALDRASGTVPLEQSFHSALPLPSGTSQQGAGRFPQGGGEAQPSLGSPGSAAPTIELVFTSEPGSQLASSLSSSPRSWEAVAPSRAGDASPTG